MIVFDPKNPPAEVQSLIAEWELTGMTRGKPSCPCGFVGGSRNILQHRCYCSIWWTYAYRHHWEKPITNPWGLQ